MIADIASKAGVLDAASEGRLGRLIEVLDQMEGWAGFEFALQDVDVGRFVRQILTMMCSLSGDWALTDRHPELREIIVTKAALPLPSPLRLATDLYLGPVIRVAGPTLFVMGSEWRWICEIAYPPFVHHLVLASSQTPATLQGTQLSGFTERAPGERVSIQGQFHLGVGHTPYPGDVRSRASDRNRHRRPLSAPSLISVALLRLAVGPLARPSVPCPRLLPASRLCSLLVSQTSVPTPHPQAFLAARGRPAGVGPPTLSMAKHLGWRLQRGPWCWRGMRR
jgi:hypothetical protein